ncbi:MAG: hypothetical protein PVJ64_05205 [Gemmatimonadales bacterium]|jgi:hypothetical protein
MLTHRPLLARIALATTICLALAGSAETLYHAVATYRDSPTATQAANLRRTSEEDERLRPLREHLPQRGVVGYASDGLSGSAFTTVDALRDYFLTQYALAPVIVVRGTNFPIVVGNYPADSAVETTGARAYRAGLVVRRDLGDGVLLLEGEGR